MSRSTSALLRRVGAIFLALALSCSLLCLPATAAEGDFQIRDGRLLLYKGTGGNVVIPNGVTEIGTYAFQDCTSLTGITIPDGVTEIGSYAFQDCTSLASVTIPDSVTTIGVQTFEDTPWQKSLGEFAIVNGILLAYQGSGGNVVIPNSVTVIGERAFSQCFGLTSVTIPDTVTEIETFAFYGCHGLTNLTIPNSVTLIGEAAFHGCSGLTGVTISNGITHLQKESFIYCRALTSITIPDSVSMIGENAFSGCESLTSVTIPASVTYMRDGALWGSTATFHVAAGSYAENRAKHSGVPFVADQMLPMSYARTQVISVDGKDITFQVYALKGKNGNETNYVKVRDLASVLSGSVAEFNVGWDGGITFHAKTPYAPNGSEMKTPFSGNRVCVPNAYPIPFHKGTQLDAITLKDDAGGAYNYFKIRDLGWFFGFNVTWAEGEIKVDTTKPYAGV